MDSCMIVASLSLLECNKNSRIKFQEHWQACQGPRKGRLILLSTKDLAMTSSWYEIWHLFIIKLPCVIMLLYHVTEERE
jgi:hypothetical protein